MNKTITINKKRVCNYSIDWDYNKGKDVKYISSKDFDITIKSNDKKMCEFMTEELIKFFEKNGVSNSEMITEIEQENDKYTITYSIPYYYKNLERNETGFDYELEEIEEIYKAFKNEMKTLKSKLKKENQEQEEQKEVQEKQSKKIVEENKAVETEENDIKLQVKDILFWQEILENSKCKTIESFMARQVGIDWDKNKTWLKIAQVLNDTMQFVNGWWIDKDIDYNEFSFNDFKESVNR